MIFLEDFMSVLIIFKFYTNKIIIGLITYMVIAPKTILIFRLDFQSVMKNNGKPIHLMEGGCVQKNPGRVSNPPWDKRS